MEQLGEELQAYQAEYAELFARREQREWATFYMRGQLSELPRKSVETMVLHLKGANAAAVRATQQFLGAGAWKDEGILEHREQLVGKDLGETDGVLIVDGSGFPKSRCGTQGALTKRRGQTQALTHSPYRKS